MIIGFEGLLALFRARLQQKIRNGEITERGLARLAGISQSHLHNALKGARVLRPCTADRVLRAVRLDVRDLLAAEEGERGKRVGGD
jgi:AraC-like DNA-binding protein